jgi:hypothetical protein
MSTVLRLLHHSGIWGGVAWGGMASYEGRPFSGEKVAREEDNIDIFTI